MTYLTGFWRWVNGGPGRDNESCHRQLTRRHKLLSRSHLLWIPSVISSSTQLLECTIQSPGLKMLLKLFSIVLIIINNQLPNKRKQCCRRQLNEGVNYLPKIGCFISFNEMNVGGVNSLWPTSHSRKKTDWQLKQKSTTPSTWNPLAGATHPSTGGASWMQNKCIQSILRVSPRITLELWLGATPLYVGEIGSAWESIPCGHKKHWGLVCTSCLMTNLRFNNVLRRYLPNEDLPESFPPQVKMTGNDAPKKWKKSSVSYNSSVI